MKSEYKIIADIITDNTRVLDVGCDDGSLMEFLKKDKNLNIRGIEISKEKVQTCVSKGLTVIEGDAEFDLKQFPDNSFDYVILGQTLQAFINPEIVIKELLRVFKKSGTSNKKESCPLSDSISTNPTFAPIAFKAITISLFS